MKTEKVDKLKTKSLLFELIKCTEEEIVDILTSLSNESLKYIKNVSGLIIEHRIQRMH